MYKVLLADDEAIILKGLKNLINWTEIGLELAATAVNGKEAVALLKDNDINIIITDIRMPDMDGLTLIRHVRDNKLNIHCIVLSGYSEFNYVKEAVGLGIENYILKPVDKNELTSTLINTINKIEDDINRKIVDSEGIEIIRNNILARWVRGDIQDDDLYERASVLDIDIHQREYLAVIVKLVTTPESQRLCLSRSSREYNKTIANLCKQLMTQSELGIAFTDNNWNSLLLFSANNLRDKELAINRLLNDLIHTINTAIHRDIFITMGTIEKSYHDVYKSYNNANKLLDYSLIYTKNTVIHFDSLTDSSSDWKRELKIDYNLLSHAIKDKNTVIVRAFVKDIFSKMKNMDMISPPQIQTLTIDILFYIINTIRTLNYNTDEVFNGYMDMLSQVYKFYNIDDMSNWMDATVLKCMDILSTEDDKISPLIKKVIEYIGQNYSSEINLTTISMEFHLNSFYLGQQFKKETGETFTNYFNKIRAEQAKHLLLSTNLKTIEIARKVGYSNTNYFSTIFKKVTGYSPSEFRDDG